MHEVVLNYPELRKTVDWLFSGTAAHIDRFAIFGALTAMSACLSPSMCSPIFNGGLALYVTLVARSGVGKRRYTMDIMDIVKAVHPLLVSDQLPASDVGMYRLLRKCPARLFCYDEYKQSMIKMLEGSSAQQGIGAAYLSAFDCPKLMAGSATKNILDSTQPIQRPNVTKIGGCTIEGFQKLVKMDAFREDGLIGRDEIVVINEIIEPSYETLEPIPLSDDILNVYAHAAKHALNAISRAEITDVSALQPTKQNPFPDTHKDITFDERIPFTIDEDAKMSWIAQSKADRISAQVEGGSAAALWNRQPERIMRIACCLAAFRFATNVTMEDFIFALSLVSENNQNSRNLIDISEQENEYAELQERIILALRSVGRAAQWHELCKIDSKLRKSSGPVLQIARKLLCDNHEIFMNTIKTKGRPSYILSLAEWLETKETPKMDAQPSLPPLPPLGEIPF